MRLWRKSSVERQPDTLWCCRHIEVRNAPRAPERVDDRIYDRRTGADSACFAGSLDAERIVPAWDVARLKLDGGHECGSQIG